MNTNTIETCLNATDKTARCVNKIVRAMSIPMALMSAAACAYDFTVGKYIWGSIMAACCAYWLVMIYYEYIKR